VGSRRGAPAIEKHIAATGVTAKVGVNATDLYIDYDALSAGTGYVAPRVKIEFGARSTGEPCEERQITCDAARQLADLEFPSAKPRVMLPKRQQLVPEVSKKARHQTGDPRPVKSQEAHSS
jgi:Nucleotidyl transferase AbiEii toxin, Type IV TA system